MSDPDATIELRETDAESGWVSLQESQYAALELALEDIGWRRMLDRSRAEFAKPGLDTIAEIARIMTLKNPLMRRAVETKSNYVWGQGVTLAAEHDEVNAVLQAFLDDPRNVAELTGHQARLDKDKELQTDGNLFLVLFTNRRTGRVRVRSVPMPQMVEIITNPDDAKEPWFYKRVWMQSTINPTSGVPETTTQTAYYPDVRYTPVFSKRLRVIADKPVLWDTPIMHTKVGGYSDWRFGVSELYAASDWARAYKEFLEDVATLMRAYSRFAWKLTTKGGKAGVQAAKTKLGSTLGTQGGTGYETNPPPVGGSTAILGEGNDLNPINVRGASVSPDDGRRFLLMVAAAVGLPETFFGDANVGNHATAKTLDRPTELQMRNRQTLWADIYTALLTYVVIWAVRAPEGPLRHLGTFKLTVDNDEMVESVDWHPQPTPEAGTKPPQLPGITASFPPILVDSEARINAIVAASTLNGSALAGMLDERTISRMLLEALGATDVDELLSLVYDATGQRKQPATPPVSTDPKQADPTPDDTDPTATDTKTQEAARELLVAIRPVLDKYRKAA